MNLRNIFGYYFDLGYQPILLAPRSKSPIFKDWNRKYDPKPYFSMLRKNVSYNMGILLGRIIDIEGDTPEANEFLDNAFKDHIHPTFKSYKSTHHIFKSRANFSITRFASRGIEIRSHQHQSVVPPSQHDKMEGNYAWTSPPVETSEIPVFDEILESKIKRFCGLSQTIIKPDHHAAWCGTCRSKRFIHKNRFEKELKIFKSMGMIWTCQKCRPIDLRPIIRTAIS
jgi:hypothetical protein